MLCRISVFHALTFLCLWTLQGRHGCIRQPDRLLFYCPGYVSWAILALIPGQVLKKVTANYPFAITSPQTVLVLALRLTGGRQSCAKCQRKCISLEMILINSTVSARIPSL